MCRTQTKRSRCKFNYLLHVCDIYIKQLALVLFLCCGRNRNLCDISQPSISILRNLITSANALRLFHGVSRCEDVLVIQSSTSAAFFYPPQPLQLHLLCLSGCFIQYDIKPTSFFNQITASKTQQKKKKHSHLVSGLDFSHNTLI